MYSTQHAAMPGPHQGRSVAPETFLLDQDAQQSLPADSVVALQQVDNRTSPSLLPLLTDKWRNWASLTLIQSSTF